MFVIFVTVFGSNFCFVFFIYSDQKVTLFWVIIKICLC